MLPANDWLTFSLCCHPKKWPRFLGVLNAFLNSGDIKPLMAMRIIEFNHLYGSNIRLFIRAGSGLSNPLSAQLQSFFKNNVALQAIPGMHGQSPAGNNAIIDFRVLLSDAMIAAFQHEAVNDETILTMALYLQLTLLKNRKAAETILLSLAGTPIFIDDRDAGVDQLEEEYIANRELLLEIKSDVAGNSVHLLPTWLQVWTGGYESILATVPEQHLPAAFRSILYFIIKQLGLTAPLITRLEYYLKKLAEAEITNV